MVIKYFIESWALGACLTLAIKYGSPYVAISTTLAAPSRFVPNELIQYEGQSLFDALNWENYDYDN